MNVDVDISCIDDKYHIVRITILTINLCKEISTFVPAKRLSLVINMTFGVYRSVTSDS